MRNILISTLLSLLFCIPAAGQNIFTIYGKVVDEKSGESIPFAPIRLKGTLTSTTTDTAGLFKITTKFISDSLIIQMLGYQTQSVSVKKVKEQSVQIALKPIGLELSEVTVKSGKRTKPPKDTAAITLYRRVVASKDLNSPDNLDKYSYQSYSKIQLDILNLSKFWQNTIFLKPFRYAFEWKDTLSDGRIAIPALIREKITDYYFQKDPKKTKELVRGVRVSGLENSSMSDLADFQFEYVDPYKNVVRIFNKSFNNPFSPIALSLYRFSIGDTQQIDGRTTYTLQFTPISKEDLVFTGYAQIDSETAAIQYIDMYPNQKANINFLTDYKIKQTFVKLDKQAWFLREENLEAIITLYDGKKQLGAVVRKTQSRNQIDLNPFLPDTIFKGDPIDQPDSVRRRSDEFWDQARHMPLTKREARIYDVVDSLRRTKAYKRYEWLGNSLSSAYVQTGPLEWGRFYQWFSGNQLEGYRLKWGFRTNRKLFSKKLFLEGYIAYGLGDYKWKYFANAKYVFPRKYGRWNQLEVFYKKDLIILGTKDPLISHDNILNLTRRSPLSNVMRISHFNLIYEREWRKGITTWFGFDHKRFYGQPGQIEFIKTNHLGQKETVPYFTVAELNFNSRIGIKEKFYENQFRRRFINNNYPVFFLGYAIGVKDLFGGRFTYHRFDVQIKQRITSPIGWTRLNIVGGYILGDCPFPLLYMTSGNAGRIFDDNNFNLLPAFEFISDKYVTAYVEHHFDGFFFNKIPYFSKLKLREVIWARAIIGSISNRSTQLYEFPYQIRAPFPKPYVEVGFGIENILKLLRVDFMWRATYRKDPDIQKWAVKFSVAPNF